MRRYGALILGLFAAGCVTDAEARPQVVLWVDTDVPVPSFADTLRIEVLEADGSVSDRRTYVQPNAEGWPVSFGVAARPDGAATMLRLRLYEASRIAGRNPSEYLLPDGGPSDVPPDQPLTAFVIERLVELRPPSAGIAQRLVVLRGACMGMAADLAARRSCNESDLEPLAEAGAGVAPLSGPPSPDAPPRPGTWTDAAEQPCTGEPRPSAGRYDEEVCIPGGVFFLGDGRLGVNAPRGAAWASIPERLVRLSPFFMDRYEVTVGRVKAAALAGFRLPNDELVTKREFGLCHFAPDDATADDLPMNCLSKELAEAFCAFDGGRALPTEAQWEYVASGRGEERLYAWGDRPATCEDAVFARVGPALSMVYGFPAGTDLGQFGQCAHLGEGPQAVGAFPSDVTADGVIGLEGNLQEWTRDSFIALTHECWTEPHLTDPVCDTGTGEYITRGGSWAAVLGSLPAALRKSTTRDGAINLRQSGFNGFSVGFRCVRSGA